MMIKTAEITDAVAILRRGGLVAFPTETVYGLGADARNEEAIQKVFAAKNRPFSHPLIVHLAEVTQVSDWAESISEEVYLLAKRFWPGPLTMILRKKPQVLELVTGGQQTVGLRVPSHPVALALLEAFQGGVVAPSANKFTHLSPTTSEAVREELGMQVDKILEGGACEVGVESTILDMSGETPAILRPGMITRREIEEVLGRRVLVGKASEGEVRVPGMHHLHYAPMTKTVLIERGKVSEVVARLKADDLPIAVVGFEGVQSVAREGVMVVEMPEEASIYAHELYQTLRELDHQGLKEILIETVPDQEKWAAINDRLMKATEPR